MSRIGVLVAVAVALTACRDDSGRASGRAKGNGEAGETVSATGVVSGVQPDRLQVKTEDGRQLALRMNDGVKVTLAGGEAQSAVITEGAPVRVSYRPKADGGDLVAVDVEPKGANAGGDAKPAPAPQGDAAAEPGRGRQGG
jgi:hypothetical protein